MPQAFAMQMLRTHNHSLLKEDLARAYCGTICCIAGHINDIDGGVDAGEGVGHASVSLFGPDDFGNALRRTNPLFFLHRWPIQFQSEFKRCRSMRGRAAIACRRIDHFIQTEK